MNAEDLKTSIEDYRHAIKGLEPDAKTIMVIVHQLKKYFSKMGAHYSYKELKASVEENTDKGIRLLEILDELIMRTIEAEQEKISAEEWTPVDDGLPPYHTDILFSNIAGQVFEGFLEEYDTDKPFIKDGKIGFNKYPDGGAWYNFRFRSFSEMSSVVAWRYKPVCYMPEQYKREE